MGEFKDTGPGLKGTTSLLLEDPRGYWESRHAKSDALRAGGDRGLSVAENVAFYAVRVGRLIELVRRHRAGGPPLHILDAGCGRGHFAQALRECGHSVVGIDVSPTAIARAKESYGGDFFACALDDFAPSRLFDVVLGVEVLFHVLSDVEWNSAVRAFSRYAKAVSTVIVTDALGDSTFVMGNYIVHRARRMYEEAFRRLGFELVEVVPFDFGANPNSFAVFDRDVR